MEKNIVIVHYSTPYLTECLVRSINLFVKNAIIYIFDNSDKEPFITKFDNVTIIDNTHGDIIDFDKWLENYPRKDKSLGRVNNWASAKHCYSVEKCMEIIGENFFLLDSDILLKKDISELIDESLIYVGETVLQPNSTIKRILPFLCYINVRLCKENNIHYFDHDYMHGLAYNKNNVNSDKYDTGAGFYIHASNFQHKDIKLNDYITHYGHGSWNKKGFTYVCTAAQWLSLNKRYWGDTKNKKVIYTCITGGYDDLKDPKFISDGFDYICFTDNTEITSNVWTIRPLPTECEELSQVKKQRYVKINPHKLLKEYDISIWVDGSVSVNGDLNNLLEETIKEDASIYVPTHPSRNCIYKEARAVISMHKDTEEHVKPQVNRYKNEGFPSEYGLLQSNILIRKHNNDDCIKFMEAWFDELKDNSHRDQLSFNYVAWKNNEIKIIYLNKTICKSKWFYWNASHKKSTKKTVITRNSNTEEIIKKVKQRIEERNLIKRKSANSFGYRLSTYG